MSCTNTTIAHHDSDPALYAALVKAFGETSHNTTRWVALDVDGVTLNFYAPRAQPDYTGLDDDDDERPF